MQQLEFKPRARIIRTVGDQLISGPEAAIIELARNAYDADASYVIVEFTPPSASAGWRINIIDDGHGMSLADIQNKWMEPATATKAKSRVSKKKLRPMMGAKGIGRFAAAKLGRTMTLRSTSVADGVYSEILIPKIDWSIFNEESYLSDIRIDYLSQHSEGPTGTEIEVTDAFDTWSKVRMERLHLELKRLISPIDSSLTEDQFDIYLDLSKCKVSNCGFDGLDIVANDHRTDEARSGEGQSHHRDSTRLDKIKAFQIRPIPLLSSCDYEVVGKFDEAGKFKGTLQIRRAGRGPQDIELYVPLRDDEESPGEFEVHLFIFDRDPPVLRETLQNAGFGQVSATAARKLLDEIAGISIYRNGFRVRPYGDPENDWLTLDKRRVQEPSVRIGHNQISGHVRVAGQHDSGLIERSSREGFEDNATFRRLTRLMRELLTKVVEPTRYDFRASFGLARKGTSFEEVRELAGLAKIRELISRLPKAEQAIAETVINKESSRLVEKIEKLEDRQRVLEAKSSLGNIIGEVLHEGAPAATFLLKAATRLQRTFPDLFNNSPKTISTKADFPTRLNLMVEESTKLNSLFVNLRPLSGGKRGAPKYFRPIEPISKAVAIFAGDAPRITVHGGSACEEVIGYPEDLSTAIVNIVGNAVYWLKDSQTKDPSIDIYIENLPQAVQIVVDDNGPGIRSEFSDHIFDVGFSLKDGGTGLGLNIAREALARSDGTLLYHDVAGSGARFEIRMPR